MSLLSAAAVMVLGIASLGIIISTIGASLIESKLMEREKEKREVNNDIKQIYTKQGVSDNTKLVIKNKIDDIENLTLEEVNTLTAMIMTLHYNLHKIQ